MSTLAQLVKVRSTQAEAFLKYLHDIHKWLGEAGPAMEHASVVVEILRTQFDEQRLLPEEIFVPVILELSNVLTERDSNDKAIYVVQLADKLVKIDREVQGWLHRQLRSGRGTFLLAPGTSMITPTDVETIARRLRGVHISLSGRWILKGANIHATQFIDAIQALYRPLQVFQNEWRHTSDLKLLQAAAAHKKGIGANLAIYALPRMGGAGTMLYSARVMAETGTSYFLAKVGSEARIEPELKAFEHYKKHNVTSETLPNVSDDLHREEGNATVCYWINQATHEPHPLVNFLNVREQPKWAQVIKAIDRLCGDLAARESKVAIIRSWPSKCYADRQPHIDGMYGRVFAQMQEVRDVCKYIPAESRTTLNLFSGLLSNDIPERLSKIRISTCHCDCHQRNVILHSDGKKLVPTLIDYRWAADCHAMADFAHLEASLSIFFLANYLPDKDYVAYLNSLTHLEGPGSSINSSPLVVFMEQVANTIRKYARRLAGTRTSWWAEYCIASLMVSLGMMTVSGSNPYKAWLTACWFATKARCAAKKLGVRL